MICSLQPPCKVRTGVLHCMVCWHLKFEIAVPLSPYKSWRRKENIGRKLGLINLSKSLKRLARAFGIFRLVSHPGLGLILYDHIPRSTKC